MPEINTLGPETLKRVVQLVNARGANPGMRTMPKPDDRSNLAGREKLLLFTQDAGTAGSDTATCSFTYDVTDINGTELLTAVDPTSGDHQFTRHGVGECHAATAGYGYLDTDGNLIILDCNEKLKTDAC